MSDKQFQWRNHPKNPGAQPFNVTPRRNKTKKRENLIVLQPKQQPKLKK
jgi:hypothetical protein